MAMSLTAGEIVALEERFVLEITCFDIRDSLPVYSYFEKGCRKKKTSKCTRQDRKVVWVFTGILHIGLKEICKCVFAREKFVFPLRSLYL